MTSSDIHPLTIKEDDLEADTADTAITGKRHPQIGGVSTKGLELGTGGMDEPG